MYIYIYILSADDFGVVGTSDSQEYPHSGSVYIYIYICSSEEADATVVDSNLSVVCRPNHQGP